MTSITFLLASVCLTVLISLPVATALIRGEKCNLKADACEPPLICINPGDPKKARCYQKRAVTEKCGMDPFWHCEDHLVCISGICKIPIERAEKCESIENAMCRPPLSCVGPRRKKKCYMKKPLGMRCGKDPYWVCQDHLKCRRGICVMEVPPTEKCEGEFKKCVKTYQCVGPKGKKRCYQKKPEGMKCGVDPFWRCQQGLKCVDNVCVKA